MKRILFVVLAVVFTLLSAKTFAQDKLKMHLGYSLAAPLGSFKKDFISNTSFRGATGEISYAITPKFALGLSSGFQDYYQRYGREVYKINATQSVSAVLTNTMELVPIILKATFTPMGNKPATILPYVSVGGGVNMVSYKQYLGEFPGSDMSSAFAAQAGAGIMVPLKKANPNFAFKIGATYNYSPYNKNDIKNLNSVGANAGIFFNLK
jgi:hypothetical protein